jgi:hypothetical protein
MISTRRWASVSPDGLILCVGAVSIAHAAESDEQVIRKMVMDAVDRMNAGDTSTFRDFWDVDADYVSVDGRLIKGRVAMEEFLVPMIKPGQVRSPSKSL